jgi:tRNA A-37 threonylcarbamoyl transferase component Bud32
MRGRGARVGAWRVRVRAGDGAGPAAWVATVERAAAGTPEHGSKHARTYRAHAGGREVFVKVYHPYGWATRLKDAFRAPKARRVWRIGTRLAGAGIAAPPVLAVGEARRGWPWRRGWVVTEAVRGAPAATCVRDAGDDLGRKRALLVAVGGAVARLHDAGFVAGDLVPPNVWIAGAPIPVVTFLDHDRTAWGPWRAPWWRARRNLVQLNRLVLAGVTATDRLRVYRAYARGRGWSWTVACRRLRWIVAKTIERRQRFDGVSPAYTARVSFRELMRAPGAAAPPPRAGGTS